MLFPFDLIGSLSVGIPSFPPYCLNLPLLSSSWVEVFFSDFFLLWSVIGSWEKPSSDESYLVRNFSGAQGSKKYFLDEWSIGSPTEVVVPTPWGNSQAKHSNGLNVHQARSMYKVSMMTKEDINEICEKYQISDTFHLHALGLEDRVTSNPSNHLGMYEEDICTSLRSLCMTFSGMSSIYKELFLPTCSKHFVFLLPLSFFRHFPEIWAQISLFKTFFMLKRLPRLRGWWFIGSRHGRAIIISSLPSSIHYWKKIVFLCHIWPTMGSPLELGRARHFIK